MHLAEIDDALADMTILVDTREQPTLRLKKRLEAVGCPYRREKLDFGDYSATFRGISLKNKVAIERKMNLDELAACYTRDRARFVREFERAQEAGAKVYLLVECASWEKLLSGQYRSLFTPKAFVASATAWLARYNCQLIFCQPESTGQLIREILYREAKERISAIATYGTD